MHERLPRRSVPRPRDRARGARRSSRTSSARDGIAAAAGRRRGDGWGRADAASRPFCAFETWPAGRVTDRLRLRLICLRLIRLPYRFVRSWGCRRINYP
eukprot:16370-Pelagococcus_subviridis.AAC.2